MALDPGKLREMSIAELGKEETELRDQIWKLKVAQTTGQLQDPHKVRAARSDLARVLTVLSERRGAERSGR